MYSSMRKNILLFALSLMSTSGVFGAEKKKNYSLEEVVVEAQKRVETQQEIPASFNVYSAENLEATSWANITDMADLVPSMEVIGVTKSRTTIFIRSIGTNKFDIGTEGSIGVFVDGVYIPRFSSLMQNLIDLERVEILRGPQGTLYGRNTIGGAISLYSKDPSSKFGGTLGLDVSDPESSQLSISLTGPISKRLRGYVAMATRDTSGFREEVRSGKNDDEHMDAFRGKLRYKVSDSLTAKLSFDYSKQEVDAFTGEVIAPTGEIFLISTPELAPFISQTEVDAEIARESEDMFSSEANIPGFTEVESLAGSLSLNWSFDNINIDSVTGYRDEDAFEQVDNDRMRFDIIQTDVEQHSKTWSEEFKIYSEEGGEYTFDDKLEWLAGVFLYQDDADRDDQISLGEDSIVYGFIDAASPLLSLPGRPGPSLVDVVQPRYIFDFLVDLKTQSWAIFGQSTYAITDEWSFTLGGRYSKDEKEFTYTESTPGLEAFVPLDNFSFSDTLEFSSFDPKVVLEWEPAWGNGFLSYLSYAKGYKSGGIQFIARTEEIASRSFDKETLYAYELGMKSRWLDEKIQVNGAAFLYDYQDQQIQQVAEVPTSTGPAIMIITDNAAESTIQGLEVDVQYLATAELLLQGTYTYLDASFDEFISVSGDDFTNNRMPAAAEHSLWLSAEYNRELKNDWELGVRLDYSWRDEQTFTADERFYEDAYAITNFAVWFKTPSENLNIRLYCTNCAETEFRTSITPLTTETTWYATGEKRRVGLGIKYTFN